LRRMFSALRLAPGHDDKGMLGWLHPRIDLNDDGAARFRFGYQDAIEADVQDTNAVGQAANIDGNAALEAVAAFDFHRHARQLSRLDADLGLSRGRNNVAFFDDLGQTSGYFADYFFAVNRCFGDELKWLVIGFDRGVGLGKESESCAFLAGRNRRRWSAKA